MRLENKVAVVTGSSSGIGEAIALAFAAEGAAVVVNYSRHEDAAQKVLDKIENAGGKGLVVGADVSDPKEVEAMVQQAVGTFGRLDIMVNNAGMERKMPFLETPFEVWQETIAVNLTGAWLGCQAAAKQMVAQGEGGRIINVSSVHEDLAMPTNSPYCATKGGVRMLMRTLAVELAPHDITVNNIAPGAIETPMDAPLEQNPDEMKELLSEIPLGTDGQAGRGREPGPLPRLGRLLLRNGQHPLRRRRHDPPRRNAVKHAAPGSARLRLSACFGPSGLACRVAGARFPGVRFYRPLLFSGDGPILSLMVPREGEGHANLTSTDVCRGPRRLEEELLVDP